MQALDVIGVVALLVCLVLIALVLRRWLIRRPGGTLEMSFRERHWRFGVGRYDGDMLRWFATFSFSLRPRRTFRRAELRVVARRAPRGSESLHVVRDSVILNCATGESMVEIAVPVEALPGMLAWLEAGSRRVVA